MRSWKEGVKTEVMVFNWNRSVSCTTSTTSYVIRSYHMLPPLTSYGSYHKPNRQMSIIHFKVSKIG